LNTLDVTQNTLLTNLHCGANNISSLDVSKNLFLKDLSCSSNNLLSLNIKNNIELESLYCSYNNISSLDLSNNLNLINLSCSDNNLSDLDVNLNVSLTQLSCAENELTSLNVKNGNNVNFSYFDTQNNPNLYCINVDNAAWSTANWTNIDSQTSFSEDCAALSIDDIEATDFNMYPNPVNSLLTINLNEKATYSLLNLNGQLLTNGTLTIGKNELNLSNFSNGLYFIRIKTSNGIVTKKLIKQ